MRNLLKIVFTIIELLVSLVLMTTVLLQSGKKSGLSGVIGGGASESFMTKTSAKSLDAKLARATKWIALVFVGVTLVLNLIG